MLHQAASVSFLRMKSHFSCSACQSVRGALGWRWASAFASACHVNSFWTKIKHPSETCRFCDYFSQNTELPDKKKMLFNPLGLLSSASSYSLQASDPQPAVSMWSQGWSLYFNITSAATMISTDPVRAGGVRQANVSAVRGRCRVF